MESTSADVSLSMSNADQHHRAKLTALQWGAILLGVVALGLLIYESFSAPAGHHVAHEHAPSLWSIIPFVGLLLSVAILPLIPMTEHWWESNQNRLTVALCFGAITLGYYVLA